MSKPRVIPVPAPSAAPASADLTRYANTLVRKAREATGASGAAIGLRSEQGEIVCEASSGRTAPEPGMHFNTESGISGECVRTGSLLICRDSESDPRVDAHVCRILGVRSIIAVPLSDGKSTTGILEVFSDVPDAFENRHLESLWQLARSATNDIAARKSAPEPARVVATQPTEVSVEEDVVAAEPEPPSIEKVRVWAQRPFKKQTLLPGLRERFRWPTAAGLVAVAVITLFGMVLLIKAWRSSTSAALSRASSNAAAPELVMKPSSSEASQPKSVRVFKAEAVREPKRTLQNAAAVEKEMSLSTNEEDAGVITVSSNPEAPRRSNDAPEVVTPPDVSAVTEPEAGMGGLISSTTSLPTLSAPVSQGVIPGKLEHMVQPVYPMWARQRHVEGSVVLRVLIGKDGLVQQVDVVQGDPELAHAAVEAVRQWRYKPYQLNNEAVATTKDVTLNFKLE